MFAKCEMRHTRLAHLSTDGIIDVEVTNTNKDKKMKSIKKLSSKGFSHIEIILLIAVVAVIGVAGYYVYHANKGSTTANAGSNNYTFIGKHSADSGYYVVKAYACKQDITSGEGKNKYTVWRIKSLVTVSNKIVNYQNNGGTGYVQLYDWSTNNFGTGHLVAFKQEAWSAGKSSTPSITVNPGPKHYISFVVNIYNGTTYQFSIPGGQNGQYMGPYAGDLKNCN